MEISRARAHLEALLGEAAAPIPSPGFASTAGTDAARALYAPPVLTPAAHQELLAKVAAAGNDADSWTRILAGLLGAAKAVALALLVALLLPALIGCSSAPPEIRQAHAHEGNALDAMQTNHALFVAGLIRDLEDAWRYQDQLLREAETRAKADGDKIALDQLALIQAATTSRQAEIRSKIARIQLDDESFQANARIAAEIHAAIAAYLERTSKTSEDVIALSGTVAELAGQLRRPKSGGAQ